MNNIQLSFVFIYFCLFVFTKANCCEKLCNFLLITTAALQGLNSHSKTENSVN